MLLLWIKSSELPIAHKTPFKLLNLVFRVVPCRAAACLHGSFVWTRRRHPFAVQQMQKEGLVSGAWLYVRTRHPFHWWGRPCTRAQGLARKAWAKLIPCTCHLTSSRISTWCGSVAKLQHIRFFADSLLPPWWCPCLPGTALPLAPTISSYLSFKTCFKHLCPLSLN